MATMAPSIMPRGRRRKDGFSKNGEKRFVCEANRCGRTFTRAEHLQRHVLNHSTGDFTCTRCRAHFKRRDLLGENLVLYPHVWEAGLGLDPARAPTVPLPSHPKVDDRFLGPNLPFCLICVAIWPKRCILYMFADAA